MCIFLLSNILFDPLTFYLLAAIQSSVTSIFLILLFWILCFCIVPRWVISLVMFGLQPPSVVHLTFKSFFNQYNDDAHEHMENWNFNSLYVQLRSLRKLHACIDEKSSPCGNSIFTFVRNFASESNAMLCYKRIEMSESNSIHFPIKISR